MIEQREWGRRRGKRIGGNGAGEWGRRQDEEIEEEIR